MLLIWDLRSKALRQNMIQLPKELQTLEKHWQTSPTSGSLSLSPSNVMRQMHDHHNPVRAKYLPEVGDHEKISRCHAASSASKMVEVKKYGQNIYVVVSDDDKCWPEQCWAGHGSACQDCRNSAWVVIGASRLNSALLVKLRLLYWLIKSFPSLHSTLCDISKTKYGWVPPVACPTVWLVHT